MPTFKYSAKSTEGKTVTGTLVAESAAGVVSELRRRNLVVFDLKSAGKRAGSSNSAGGIGSMLGKDLEKAKPGKAKSEELVVFTRQLSTMICAGITLLDALEIISEQIENLGFKKTVKVIAADIRGGSDFSKALSNHPKTFKPIYVSMVKAGEISGQLDEILIRLAEYLESSERLKREIKSAMTYPVVSLVMVLAITMFLMIGIVPQFKPIFEQLDIELPAMTQGVMAASDWLVVNWLIAAGILAVAGFALAAFRRSPTGGLAFDWFMLKVPIFGQLFQKVALSRFARTFATLLKSGVPILGALDIVAATSGNRVIEDAILRARDSVRNGNSLSEPLSDSPVFPPMVTRMIAIGERSGSLEQLLEKIGTFYDEQVSATVKGLTAMIEPLLIGVMGFLVGGIVLAVFLPIFKIQEKLSGGGG